MLLSLTRKKAMKKEFYTLIKRRNIATAIKSVEESVAVRLVAEDPILFQLLRKSIKEEKDLMQFSENKDLLTRRFESLRVMRRIRNLSKKEITKIVEAEYDF